MQIYVGLFRFCIRFFLLLADDFAGFESLSRVALQHLHEGLIAIQECVEIDLARNNIHD